MRDGVHADAMGSNVVRALVGAGGAALLLGMFTAPAAADPLDFGTTRVVSGSVSFSTADDGTVTWRQTSPLAVVEVTRLHLAAEWAWRIEQPSATSALIVTVADDDPPAGEIIGSVRATGQVAISDPGGLWIAARADIRAQSLVATSLPLAQVQPSLGVGRTVFAQGAGGTPNLVQQEGRVTVAGGVVGLLGAGRLENEGTITAPGGNVVLAATTSAAITFGLPRPTIDPAAGTVSSPTAPVQKVVNSGVIAAVGGSALLYAAASDSIWSSGWIRSGSSRLIAERYFVGTQQMALSVTCELANGRLAAAVTIDGRARAPEQPLVTPRGTFSTNHQFTRTESGTRSLFVDGLDDPASDLVPDSYGSLSCSAEQLTAGSPRVAGTARAGRRLTALPGAWAPSGITFSYQWLRDGAAISAAVSSSYRVRPADTGHRISVRVTGAKAAYEIATRTTPSVRVVRSWKRPLLPVHVAKD